MGNKALLLALSFGVLLFFAACGNDSKKTRLPTDELDELVGTWNSSVVRSSTSGLAKIEFFGDGRVAFYPKTDSDTPADSGTLDVKEKWQDQHGAFYFSAFIDRPTAQAYGLFKISSGGNYMEVMYAHRAYLLTEETMPAQVSSDAADGIKITYLRYSLEGAKVSAAGGSVITWFSIWDDLQAGGFDTGITLALEEHFDVKFVVTGPGPVPHDRASGPAPPRNQIDEMRPHLLSETMPDVYCTTKYAVNKELLENAAVITFDEIKSFMPSFYKELELYASRLGSTAEKLIAEYRVGNDLYFLPRIALPQSYPPGILWRKDILDDLDVDVPTTIDEWTAVFAKYRAQNPDAWPFAIRLEIGYVGNGFLFAAAGIGPWWEYRDGRVVPSLLRSEAIHPIETLRQWYKNEYVRVINVYELRRRVSPHTLFIEGETIVTVMVRPHGGNWVCDPPYVEGSIQAECLEKNPAAEFILSPYPVFESEIAPSLQVDTSHGYTVIGFGRHLEDDREKLHAIMRIIDELGTDPDLFVLTNLGIEGKDWDWIGTGDQRYVMKTENDDPSLGYPPDPADFYGGQFVSYWGIGYSETNAKLLQHPKTTQSIQDYALDPNGMYGNSTIPWRRDAFAVPLDMNSSGEVLAAANKIYREFSSDVSDYISSGNGSAQSLYDSYVSDWNTPGGQKAIQMLTDWYESFNE